MRRQLRLLVENVVVGVSQQRSVVGVKEQLGGKLLEAFGRAVADEVKLAVRVAGANGRAVRRPLGVKDCRVALVFDDVFVLVEAPQAEDVPDADEAIVSGREEDVDGDRVRFEDEDLVFVAAKGGEKLARGRVPDFEAQVGHGCDHLAVVERPAELKKKLIRF